MPKIQLSPKRAAGKIALTPSDLRVFRHDILFYGEPGSGKTWMLGPLVAELDLKILVIHCGIGGHGLLSVRDYLTSVGKPERYYDNFRLLEPRDYNTMAGLVDSWDALLSPFSDEDKAWCEEIDLLVIEELNGFQYAWSEDFLGERLGPDEKERFAYYGELKQATERYVRRVFNLHPAGRRIAHFITTHENTNKTIDVGGEHVEGRLAPALVGASLNLVLGAVDFTIRTAKLPPPKGSEKPIYGYQYGTSDLDKARGDYPSSGPALPVALWHRIQGEVGPETNLAWPAGQNPFQRKSLKLKDSKKDEKE